MMDRDDVIDLLAIIQAKDHRTIGEVDIELWTRVLGSITKDEACDAILAHIRDMPGMWLEPGHVVARVRAARRDAYERSDPNYRDADRIEAMFGDESAVRRDRHGKIDKSAPDEDDYPAEWTSEQRLKAYWAKIQARRDQSEYETAIRHPGTLLIKPPASDETRAKAIQEFANSQLSFDDAEEPDDAVPYVNPLLVACPFCKSAAGDRCTLAGMPGQPRQKLASTAGHPSRIERAAREAGHPEPVVQAIVTAAAKRQTKTQRAKWPDALRTPEPVPAAAAASEPSGVQSDQKGPSDG